MRPFKLKQNFHLFLFRSISLFILINSTAQSAIVEQEKKAAESKKSDLLDKIDNVSFKAKLKDKSLGLSDVPGFDSIPLPSQLKNKLNKIKIENFELVMDKGEITVKGTANLFGEPLNVEIRQTKVGDAKGIGAGKRQYIFIVDLKRSFKFSDVADAFKPLDDLKLSDASLIISDIKYTDPVWGDVDRGVSLAGKLEVAGRIKQLAEKIGMTEVALDLKGTFAPGITGSSFSAAFPGTIKFGDKGKPVAQTTPLTLTIYAKTEGPTVGLKGGLRINIPNQDPLSFLAEIEVGMLKASLDGWMEGMFKFPKVPLKLGNVAAKATIDYATAAASGGLLSLSGFGLGGAIAVGKKQVEMDVYFEVSATTDVLAAGNFEGGLYLEDLIALTSDVVKLASKGKIDLMQKVKGKIPHIGLDKAKFYVAPKAMRFGGRNYEEGIEVESEASILKTTAAAKIKIGADGMDFGGYMNTVNIGPLTITGSGADKIEGTADDGPILKVIADPKGTSIDRLLEAYIDAKIKLDILGGLSASTHLDLKLNGAEFKTTVNLFNKLKSRLEGEFELDKPEQGKFTIELEQSALAELSKLMNQASQEVLKGRKKIEEANAKAQQDLETAKKALQQKTEKLKELEDLRNRLGIATLKCTGKN